MAKKLYYKIGEACRVLDIQPYVLRYWETEFPGLAPTKSKSGQRVYNEADLAMIQRIKELLYDEGYTIAGAKKKLETEEPPARLVKKARPRKAAEAPADGPAPSEDGSEAGLSEPAEAEKPEAAGAPDPARAEPKAKAKAKPSKSPSKRVAPRPRSRKAAPSSKADAARVARLERAIRKALAEARSILALLDKSA